MSTMVPERSLSLFGLMKNLNNKRLIDNYVQYNQ